MRNRDDAVVASRPTLERTGAHWAASSTCTARSGRGEDAGRASEIAGGRREVEGGESAARRGEANGRNGEERLRPIELGFRSGREFRPFGWKSTDASGVCRPGRTKIEGTNVAEGAKIVEIATKTERAVNRRAPRKGPGHLIAHGFSRT
jgi:hypothetical protein